MGLLWVNLKIIRLDAMGFSGFGVGGDSGSIGDAIKGAIYGAEMVFTRISRVGWGGNVGAMAVIY